jgi:outer membrane protein OmpA-like peptidoglycan-associated protein
MVCTTATGRRTTCPGSGGSTPRTDQGTGATRPPQTDLSRRLAQVVPARETCDTNESNPVIWFEYDSTRVRVDGGMDGMRHLMSAVRRAQGHLAAAGPGAVIHLYGYASEEGGDSYNLDLSRRRAAAVKTYLEDAGLDPATVVAVGLGEDTSLAPLPMNRRVEVCPTPAIEYIEMPPETIVGPGVDCAKPAAASDLTQFAFLVACLEARLATTHGPVDILRTLREIYYGSDPFDTAACGDRESGTVQTLGLMDPMLLAALEASKVTSGVDVGHLFTGLEGMLCPRTSVDFAWYAPTVRMANEDVLTWGGDLGSAAASRVDGFNDSGWVFKTAPPWSRYFLTPGTLASREDLLGDIDAFVWRANLKGVGCAATKGTRMPSPATPISRLLLDYYEAPPGAASGLAAADRFRCFTEAVGGVVVGGSILNKPALVARYGPDVFSFAHLFYLKGHKLTTDVADVLRLQVYSSEMTALFFDWVESQL